MCKYYLLHVITDTSMCNFYHIVNIAMPLYSVHIAAIVVVFLLLPLCAMQLFLFVNVIITIYKGWHLATAVV